MKSVLKSGKKLIGIEVKTSAQKAPVSFGEFERKFKPGKVITICYKQDSKKEGSSELIGLEDFLINPKVVL